jgi:hypothetical protein
MLCDFIAFGLIIIYYIDLLEDPDIMAFNMDQNAKGRDTPDEPDSSFRIRTLLLVYFGTNFISYFAVNTKA